MADRQCFSFQNDGTCKFGDSCRYSHGDAPAGAQAPAPRRAGGGECNNFKRTGNCHFGTSCKYEHASSQPSSLGFSGGNKTCRQFEQKGECTYGDNCRYSHGSGHQSDAQSERPFVASPVLFFRLIGGDAGFTAPPQASQSSGSWRTPQVCYNFRDNGECKFGSQCRYAQYVFCL